MKQAIEELKKSTAHLREAMKIVDEDMGKELLEAHQRISAVRSRIEQGVEAEKFERVLGLSR